MVALFLWAMGLYSWGFSVCEPARESGLTVSKAISYFLRSTETFLPYERDQADIHRVLKRLKYQTCNPAADCEFPKRWRRPSR
ncbi:hypothetical protein EMIT0P253_30246 [Pseudomonas sp. IT-P253]|jgi:hypothetical protein